MKSRPGAHPISCRCGALKGEVRNPQHGTRAVCYCRDCQAFARFLDCPAGMMDALHGTDIVAVRPRFVSLTTGLHHLACMSLSPKGTLRWYTRCCGTPIGNTPRDRKVSHVGLVHSCLGTSSSELEHSFGPIRMRVNTQSAAGVVPANRPLVFALAIARYMGSLAWTRMSGGYRVNPFFASSSGLPIAEPQVVSRELRATLRGDP